MKIPNEFYPSFEDTDYGFLYSPRQGSMDHSGQFSGISTIGGPVDPSNPRIPALRYKADESLLDLIVPITTELVECPSWLKMTGGGTAYRMYQIIYKRVFERPFFQMYKLAIAHKRFDILGQFSYLTRCLEACFRLARRLPFFIGREILKPI